MTAAVDGEPTNGGFYRLTPGKTMSSRSTSELPLNSERLERNFRKKVEHYMRLFVPPFERERLTIGLDFALNQAESREARSCFLVMEK